MSKQANSCHSLAILIFITEFCKMKRKREPIRLLLTWIRGAVGKEFVIKHYKYGPVKTKFPDMTRIIVSAQQRKCRNLFKEAVDYAKSVYADPVKKKQWAERPRKRPRLFNAIIRKYMLAAKEAAYQREKIGAIIIRKCFPPGSGLSSRAQARDQLNNRYLRQHPHPSRITDKTVTGVYI